MAEILDGAAGLTPRRRYPWDEWTDGQTRRIAKGVDFDCPTYSMRVMIYQRARKDGLTATARLEGRVGAETAIVFRFERPEASA